MALARYVFHFAGYWPPLGALLCVVFGAAILVALAGWLATRRVARAAPITVLRRG
jgi:putative ABC transport system permease protein